MLILSVAHLLYNSAAGIFGVVHIHRGELASIIVEESFSGEILILWRWTSDVCQLLVDVPAIARRDACFAMRNQTPCFDSPTKTIPKKRKCKHVSSKTSSPCPRVSSSQHHSVARDGRDTVSPLLATATLNPVSIHQPEPFKKRKHKHVTNKTSSSRP